jgi:hypothetical protein
MVKAVFHKGQRVFVRPVATWAVVESVNPHWVTGVEEPLRVTYDAGLGREFQAHELAAEDKEPVKSGLIETENWRVVRAANRISVNPAHPYPGTFPIVVTDEKDWGGWRTPMSEYEREPLRIEQQARLIANALRLMRVARELVDFTADNPNECPAQMLELAAQAEGLLAAIYHAPTPKPLDAVKASRRD